MRRMAPSKLETGPVCDHNHSAHPPTYLSLWSSSARGPVNGRSAMASMSGQGTRFQLLAVPYEIGGLEGPMKGRIRMALSVV